MCYSDSQKLFVAREVGCESINIICRGHSQKTLRTLVYCTHVILTYSNSSNPVLIFPSVWYADLAYPRNGSPKHVEYQTFWSKKVATDVFHQEQLPKVRAQPQLRKSQASSSDAWVFYTKAEGSHQFKGHTLKYKIIKSLITSPESSHLQYLNILAEDL